MIAKMLLTLAFTFLILCTSSPAQQPRPSTAQAQPRAQKPSRYSCPMHPEVTSAKPGKCPKCGMALRIVKDAPATSPAPPEEMNSTTREMESTTPLRIPEVPVYDQNGKRLKFYTDLVRGKTVAINFIFTTCTTICPPLTATFRRVQRDLGDRVGRDLFLISISVDPDTDVPERLHDFAAKFKAGPGWTFVTGAKPDIDLLLKALGAAVADKNDHTPLVLIGNETTGYWTRTYGLAPPSALVKIISEAANKK